VMFPAAQFAASDSKWKTQTCPVGFGTMGMWPEYADGTDINAIDVSRDRSLLVTADDFGQVKLFNYPCVAQNAAFRASDGHSSHVMNAKFLGHDAMVGTVGGVDKAIMLWDLVAVPASSPKRTYNHKLN